MRRSHPANLTIDAKPFDTSTDQQTGHVLHDEVLLAGHSSGRILVMMVLDRLLTQGYGRNTKFLTLAQLVRMVTFDRGYEIA